MGLTRAASQDGGTAHAGSISPASAGSCLLAGGSTLEGSPVTTLATAGPCPEGGGAFKLFADVEGVEFEPLAETACAVEEPGAAAR